MSEGVGGYRRQGCLGTGGRDAPKGRGRVCRGAPAGGGQPALIQVSVQGSSHLPRNLFARVLVALCIMRKPGPLPLASWRSAQRVAWVRLTCAVLLPFLCAAVVRSMYFSANSTSAHPVQQRQASGALEADAGLQPACDGQLCGDPEAMLEAARAAAAAAAAMAGPDRRRPVIAPATSSLTAGAPAPAQRPRIFLFIGILSGRGYRHRRMAVRGAWASKAQVEGQVVTKFVLSEDERTPQVGCWIRGC